MSTNFIYIGPSIPQLGLQRWSLYRVKEPPELLQEIIAKNRLIGCLYISTEYLGEAKKNLRLNKQSAESLAYAALLAIAKTIPR